MAAMELGSHHVADCEFPAVGEEPLKMLSLFYICCKTNAIFSEELLKQNQPSSTLIQYICIPCELEYVLLRKSR